MASDLRAQDDAARAAPLSNKEAERLVCKHYGESPAGFVEGPYTIARRFAWRVWTDGGDAGAEARYLLAKTEADILHLPDFGPFIMWLHQWVRDRENDFTLKLKETEAELALKKQQQDLSALAPVVAALVVLALVALLWFYVANNPQTKLPVGWIVTGLGGAAVGFLFPRGRRGA